MSVKHASSKLVVHSLSLSSCCLLTRLQQHGDMRLKQAGQRTKLVVQVHL